MLWKFNLVFFSGIPRLIFVSEIGFKSLNQIYSYLQTGQNKNENLKKTCCGNVVSEIRYDGLFGPQNLPRNTDKLLVLVVFSFILSK